MDARTIDRLRVDYLTLVRETLPKAAKGCADWPLRLDHCFMRIVLDHVLGCCWYEVLDRRRPAYRQLSTDQLEAAISTAEQMLRLGRPYVERLNAASLQMRGKESVAFTPSTQS